MGPRTKVDELHSRENQPRARDFAKSASKSIFALCQVNTTYVRTMARETTRPDVAIFIDFENIYVSVHEKLDESPDFESIMDRCSELGRVIIARAYADWYRYPRITSSLYANGIEPIYVPTYYYDKEVGRTGRAIKNSVDMNLCIDAMKTLFLNSNVEKFVLITGDRDFIPLVNSIRQLGKEVIIIGIGGAASSHLAQSADEFILYEQIVGKNVPADTSSPKLRVVQPNTTVSATSVREPAVADPPPSAPPSDATGNAAAETEPNIYDVLVEAVHLVRERGYIPTLGSLKQVVKELMGGEFKESRYKDLDGRSFSKFKDFVLDAERRGKVQIYTNGTVSEVFLPGEDAQKLSLFAEQREGVLRPEVRTPTSIAAEVGKHRPSLVPLSSLPPASPPPSPSSTSSPARSRRRRRPRSQSSRSREAAPAAMVRDPGAMPGGEICPDYPTDHLFGESLLTDEVSRPCASPLTLEAACEAPQVSGPPLADEAAVEGERALLDSTLLCTTEEQDTSTFTTDPMFGEGYFLPDAIQPDEELLSTFVREKETVSSGESLLPWSDDEVELLNAREEQRLSQMIESLRGEREDQEPVLPLSLIEAGMSDEAPDPLTPVIPSLECHSRDHGSPEATGPATCASEPLSEVLTSDVVGEMGTADRDALPSGGPGASEGQSAESAGSRSIGDEGTLVHFTEDEWQAFRTMMQSFEKPASFGQIFDALRGLRQKQLVVRTNEQLRSMINHAIDRGMLERVERGRRMYYVLAEQTQEA